LLTFKGNVLKEMQKHEEAIHAYLQVLAYNPAQPKLVKILSQMALCYDFMGNLQKAA
jgi:tetratricopeptide (TPR) repeat protein